MTREQAITILKHLADAIVETVNEAGPEGAPAGPMYAAFMERGLSLETFEKITAALVEAGKIKKRGYCFYAVGA